LFETTSGRQVLLVAIAMLGMAAAVMRTMIKKSLG
jgi:hypothetical protein